MTSTRRELLDVLDLKPDGEDTFIGEQVDPARIRVFGGQVVGQALVAAQRTAPEHMTAHSLHSYFLRAGDATIPISYTVERVRDGRAFATRRVMAVQKDRPIFAMMANFHVGEPGFAHQDPMPLAPPPEDSRPYIQRRRQHPDEEPVEYSDWGSIDMRYAGNTRVGDILGDAVGVEARSWLRYDGPIPDDLPTHQAVLAYMSDLTLFGTAALPHAEPGLADFREMASLDHSVWFHEPFRVDEWLLYAHRSPWAGSGRGIVQAAFYTESGRLVASVVQEGLMRPLEHLLPGSPAR